MLGLYRLPRFTQTLFFSSLVKDKFYASSIGVKFQRHNCFLSKRQGYNIGWDNWTRIHHNLKRGTKQSNNRTDQHKLLKRGYASHNSATSKRKRKRRKPYSPHIKAKAQLRRTSNIARQEELRAQRRAAAGDAVYGKLTPLVESFDTAFTPTTEKTGQSLHSLNNAALDSTTVSKEFPPLLNKYFLNTKDIDDILLDIKQFSDIGCTAFSQDELNDKHEQATQVVRRLLSLDHANSKDKFHLHVQRCIHTFGRHATDNILSLNGSTNFSNLPLMVRPRAGPDTGSSEVQIAVLTLRIRKLAIALRGHGRTDQKGKRALTLLVHRRQKLLRYLNRKDRGGLRWQNTVNLLGLTDATWKGEISIF